MYNPQKYSRNLDPFVSAAREIFKKFGPQLKWNSQPESVLDLGIGDGRITKEVILPLVPKNVNEYVGGDISETMLYHAIKIVKHDKFKTLQIDATIKSLPIELQNRFDHVISSFSFQLISSSDIRQTFENIHSMLKSDGQFFFTAYETTVLDEVYDELDEGKWCKYNNRKAFSPFYHCQNPSKEYENLLKTCGFVNCRIYRDHITPKLTEKAFEELITAVNIRLPFVEEDDRGEYLEDYLEGVKNSSMVKTMIDDETGGKIMELHHHVITGIATKPLQ